jgi:hypothetical protein
MSDFNMATRHCDVIKRNVAIWMSANSCDGFVQHELLPDTIPRTNNKNALTWSNLIEIDVHIIAWARSVKEWVHFRQSDRSIVDDVKNRATGRTKP